MKNLMKFGFMATVFGAMMFLTSCGGDEEIVAGPSLVVTTTPAANGDGIVELMIGDELTIKIVATTPAGFNTMKISDGSNELEKTRNDLGLTATDTEATYTFTGIQYDAAGTATITATVVDETSAVATEDINIVISGTPVTTENIVLLAAPLGDKNSDTFYSSNLNTIYSMNDVLGTSTPVSKEIDFGYYYGTTNKASLASPNSYPFAYGQDAWGTRNATKFRASTLTADGFDAIASEEQLVAEFEVGSGETELIADLAIGDVIAFKTASTKTDGSKFGLIKVTNVVAGAESTGKIEFTVLVQQ